MQIVGDWAGFVRFDWFQEREKIREKGVSWFGVEVARAFGICKFDVSLEKGGFARQGEDDGSNSVKGRYAEACDNSQ